MKSRQFLKQQLRESGQTRIGYRVTCGSCGVGETIGGMGFGADVASEQIPKKFASRGWEIGKRQDGSDDRCPACVNRGQEARRRKLRIVKTEETEPMKPVEKIKEFSQIPPAVAAKAEPPREMTREHRRLIFLKLEEVYGDEKTGYGAGWSDQRVASDLGIPRAWVSKIRDENFGPDRSSEVETALTEAKAVLSEAEAFRKDLDALAVRGAEILKRTEGVDRIVKRIESSFR